MTPNDLFSYSSKLFRPQEDLSESYAFYLKVVVMKFFTKFLSFLWDFAYGNTRCVNQEQIW